MRDVRSLPPAEVAIEPILAAGLWALQTRSWRRTELHVKNRDDRPGSNRQTENRVLPGPLGSEALMKLRNQVDERVLFVAIGVGVGIALAIIGYLLHWI